MALALTVARYAFVIVWTLWMFDAGLDGAAGRDARVIGLAVTVGVRRYLRHVLADQAPPDPPMPGHHERRGRGGHRRSTR